MEMIEPTAIPKAEDRRKNLTYSFLVNDVLPRRQWETGLEGATPPDTESASPASQSLVRPGRWRAVAAAAGPGWLRVGWQLWRHAPRLDGLRGCSA
jgi:hypothetical protein